MANIKFSAFTLVTDVSGIQEIVGYNGTQNVRITPANFVATSGGGGASSLNGLTDCLVDTDSLYVGEVPSGLSGNPQGNTVLGIDAGSGLISGTNNTFIGNDAGIAVDNSANNVLIGWESGKAMTGTGTQHNVCIGTQTFQTSAGTGSVVVGYQAGRISSTSESVYVGYQSGWANGGGSNAALGYQALFVGGGANSVGIGKDTAKNNAATGHVSVGYQAGFSQTSGTDNTNIGYQAGYSGTTATYRTMVGFQAGYANTGTQNVFIGQRSGSGAGSGEDNAAVGSNTLTVASAGSFNAVVGNLSLQNCTGSNNSTLGYKAGQAVTSGANNVAIGFQAMDANTDGDDNVAIGYNALGAATSDGRCVAIGFDALAAQNQTFSPSNTAVGYQADDTTVTGFQRTALGAVTGRTGTGSNITNVGYSAIESSNSASNEVTLGNSSVGALRCQVTTITALSDERDKTSIEDLPYGLDFVDSLKPRKFVWDHRAETNRDGEEFFSANKGKKDIGFIAQELQSVDDNFLNLVYDSNPEKLEASYGKLIPVLVQAIKELKAEIELLKS